MKKLQAMHSYLAYTHSMHISHLISKQKFILLAKTQLTIEFVKQEIISKFARNWKLNG